MDVFETIDSRRSIRVFEPRPIPKPTLEKIMRAAIMAPNPLNAQTWRFDVVVGSQRDALVRIISQFPTHMADLLRVMPEDVRQTVFEFSRDLGRAPAIVVVSVPALGDSHTHKVDIIAAGAAVQNLQLAAWAEGVGCVCLTNALWVEAEIVRYLQLTRRELVTVIPMGYPAVIPAAPPRRENVIAWIGLDNGHRPDEVALDLPVTAGEHG
jgi:nitroreductase